MTNAIEKRNVMYVAEADCVKEEILVSKIMENKELAMSTFLQCAVNIGKHLAEAKKIVKHGEWERWLDERVQFSPRTAQNYMRIHKEYEENGLNFLKTQASADLGYSQVVEILSLPKAMQEEFVQQNNVAEMSARDIKKAVKDIKAENQELITKMQTMEKTMEKEKSRFDVESGKKDKEIETLREKTKQLEKAKADAEKNRDKVTAKAVEDAIKDNKEKMETLEMEKKSLFERLDFIEKKHEEEIETLKKQAVADSKALAEKIDKEKTAELMKNKEVFDNRLKQLEDRLQTAKAETESAKLQAEVKEDVVKCKVLLENIYTNSLEITKMLTALEKKDSAVAEEVKTTLSETLSALLERNKVKVVKGGKKAS